MKKFEIQQIDLETGNCLSTFSTENIINTIAYYDGFHFESDWMILENKNFGVNSFYHRIRITESEYNEYMNEYNKIQEIRRQEIMKALLAK